MNDQTKSRIEQMAFFLTYMAKRHPAFVYYFENGDRWNLVNVSYNTLREALFIDVIGHRQRKRFVELGVSELIFNERKNVLMYTRNGLGMNMFTVKLPIVLDEAFVRWKQGVHHTYPDYIDSLDIVEPIAGIPNR